MRNLWAPWRMKYILSKKPVGCIFCQMLKEDADRKNFILLRKEDTFAVMNPYPYSNGHIMVLPNTHVSDMEGLSSGLMASLMELVQFSISCIKKEMAPEGFNVGLNLGKVAGAGIEEHLHIHIVPRWVGDVNFMAVQDDIKVIPELVEQSYERLLPYFKRNA